MLDNSVFASSNYVYALYTDSIKFNWNIATLPVNDITLRYESYFIGSSPSFSS